MVMKFSDEFICKIKDLFPNWQDMHSALDSGNPYVATYLGMKLSNLGPNIGAQLVLDCLDEDNPEKLRQLARRVLLISELRSEAIRVYESHLNN